MKVKDGKLSGEEKKSWARVLSEMKKQNPLEINPRVTQ